MVCGTRISDQAVQPYPIGMILPVPGSRRLVLFEAYPTRDVITAKSGARGVPVRRRQPARLVDRAGTRRDGRHAPEFDATRPATDTFSAISNIDERFYASRIGGDTFVIDMSPPFIVIFQRAVRPRQVTNSSDRPCQLAMTSTPRVTQLSLRRCKHRRRACEPALLAEPQGNP